MPELETDGDRAKHQKTNSVILEDYLGGDDFLRHMNQILPKHLTGDRFATIALRQVRAVPDLNKCSLESIAGSVMQAGTLGLEIATQGECWIIPRNEKVPGTKNEYSFEASLQIGYLGHLALAWRSNQVKSIMCDVVSKDDAFDHQRGTNGYLHHKPKAGRDISPDAILWAYAIVETVGGGQIWWAIDNAEIERLRTTGPSGNSPAWRNWYDQMAMGKVLKRTLKFCPKSREMSRAINIDDTNDANLPSDFRLDAPLTLPARVTGTEAQQGLEDLQRNQSQGPKADPEPARAAKPEAEAAAAPAAAEKKGMGF